MMKSILVIFSIFLSLSSLAQPFKPDISGRVSGDAFKTFCKNRGYMLVGTFDSLPHPAKTMAAQVVKDNKWIYVDLNGKEFANHDELAKHYGFYQEPYWDDFSDDDIAMEPELLPIPGPKPKYTGTYVENGKKGYKRMDKILIQPKYQQIEQLLDFNNFLFFLVENNGLYGICDYTGKEIIPTTYNSIKALNFGSRDCYFIAYSGNKPCALSRGGIVTVPPVYDILTPVLSEKDFVIITSKNQLSGLLTSTGKTILEPTYPNIEPALYNASKGFIITMDGKKGYLNRVGQLKVPAEYKNLSYNESDFLLYWNDQFIGAVDTNGTKILEPVYSQIEKPKGGNCYIATITENGVKRTGIYALNGQVIEEPKFGAYLEYGNAYLDNEIYLFAKEKMYRETGMFNVKTLKWTIPCEYRFRIISGDYVVAANAEDTVANKLLGLIGADGTFIIPCMYRELEYNDLEKLAVVRTDGKYGVVDQNNKTILPFNYEKLTPLRHRSSVQGNRNHVPRGYFIFEQVTGAGLGVIHSSGKITIPQRYTEIIPTSNGLICISGDTSRILSAEGKQSLLIPHVVSLEPEGYFSWIENAVRKGIDLYGNQVTIPPKPVLRQSDFYPPEPEKGLEPVVDSNVIHFIVDEQASFPGGNSELMQFLAKNLKYPETAIENGIEGKCYLSFVVEKDGSITDVQVKKKVSDCPECDREAVRVVKLMPKWIPGKLNGKAVRSSYTLPITYKYR